jgi:hypothetical protein
MLRHTFRLVGIMLLSLTSFAHAALADSYTYQTIDVPYPTFSTRITGLTDLGKLAGLYTDLAGVDRSWRFVPPNPYEDSLCQGTNASLERFFAIYSAL